MAEIEGKILITSSQGRPCWAEGKRAIFHRWIDSARPAKPRGYEDDPMVEHFQLQSTKGLVEFEDGTMRHVWPTEIQFADGADKFDEYDWDLMEQLRDNLPFTLNYEAEA